MNQETFDAYKEAELAGDTKRAVRLLDTLVRDNMGLVHKLARRFHKASGAICELEDVIQAGTIGLLTGIRRLDPAKGRLSTFATWWIRAEIQKEILSQATIKRPQGSGKPWSVALKEEEILRKEGRKARLDELGEHKGKAITQSVYDAWIKFPFIVSIDTSVMSEDGARTSLGEGGTNLSLHERTTDGEMTAEDTIAHEGRVDAMIESLGVLDDRELRVVTALFVDGLPPKTVAANEGFTRQHIERIRDTALARMRAHVEELADRDEDA